MKSSQLNLQHMNSFYVFVFHQREATRQRLILTSAQLLSSNLSFAWNKSMRVINDALLLSLQLVRYSRSLYKKQSTQSPISLKHWQTTDYAKISICILKYGKTVRGPLLLVMFRSHFAVYKFSSIQGDEHFSQITNFTPSLSIEFAFFFNAKLGKNIKIHIAFLGKFLNVYFFKCLFLRRLP